jgi:hypothetical protein
MSLVYKTFLGSPLKLWASIGHWAIWHFDLNKYSEQQKPRVITSLAAVFTFMAVAWPLLVYYTGWAGLVKFWLMPWLGYHFWMSKSSSHSIMQNLSQFGAPLPLHLFPCCFRYFHCHSSHCTTYSFQAC